MVISEHTFYRKNRKGDTGEDVSIKEDIKSTISENTGKPNASMDSLCDCAQFCDFFFMVVTKQTHFSQ